MRREEFEAVFGTPTGLDFEQVARLYGLRYERISDLSALAAATRETGLVEVPVDRRRSVGLHARLNNAAAEAISRALA